MAQAGALLAVVFGGIAVTPAVALADPPDVQITGLPTDVASGAPIEMQYRVADANDGGGPSLPATIRVRSDLRCTGACGQIAPVDQNGTPFTARFTAPNVNAGETREVRIEVTASINGEESRAESTVTVKGPEKPQNVRQISGKVKDEDGKAIAGATVAIRDSNGNTSQTTSNGSGGYSFTSSESRPIAPGTVTVGAGKTGFDPASVTVEATAGRTVNVSLTLKSLAATASPSASASASASAKASTEPAEEASEPVVDNTAADTENKAATEDDGGSMLFIILGALLVAAGVGAIVLVLMRRRNNNDDGDDLPAGPGGAGVVPPSQGRFHDDATRVAAPMGAAAATVVAPLSGAPSMADAPTVLQRPVPAVDDEFPDPYGAPIPPQGGYAGASGWDAPQPDTYGPPTQYGPAADDGYAPNGYAAAPAGGYGYEAQPEPPQQPRRYDEPTGLYRPEQDAGYGGDYDQGGYGGEHRGGGRYGDGEYGGQQYGGGYGEPDAAGQGGWGAPPSGGIDNGNAYGPQGGGTYGAAPAAGGQYGGGQQYGGYGDADGYAAPDDQAGYDNRAGYPGHPQQPPAGGAYRDQYDEQTGYDPQGYRGQSR